MKGTEDTATIDINAALQIKERGNLHVGYRVGGKYSKGAGGLEGRLSWSNAGDIYCRED